MKKMLYALIIAALLVTSVVALSVGATDENGWPPWPTATPQPTMPPSPTPTPTMPPSPTPTPTMPWWQPPWLSWLF